MSRKTYSYRDKLECSVVFFVGQSKMRVPFAGGSISAYGVQPARYTTSNLGVQAVIEQSDEFKSGRIFISAIKDAPEAQPEAVFAEAPKEYKEYPLVTTAQQARETLKAEYGAPQSELQTASAIRQYAEGKKVSFPNWK